MDEERETELKERIRRLERKNQILRGAIADHVRDTHGCQNDKLESALNRSANV